MQETVQSTHTLTPFLATVANLCCCCVMSQTVDEVAVKYHFSLMAYLRRNLMSVILLVCDLLMLGLSMCFVLGMYQVVE